MWESWNACALSLYLIGILVLGGCWTAFIFIRLQEKRKLWIVWSLCVLSLAFALLTRVNTPIFGSLALVLPVLSLLAIGSLMLVIAVVQGMHAVSFWMLGIVLSALLCFGACVAMLVLQKNG